MRMRNRDEDPPTARLKTALGSKQNSSVLIVPNSATAEESQPLTTEDLKDRTADYIWIDDGQPPPTAELTTTVQPPNSATAEWPIDRSAEATGEIMSPQAEERLMTVRKALKKVDAEINPVWKQTLFRAALMAKQRLDAKGDLTTVKFQKRRRKAKQAKVARKKNRR